ncbi:MULTISPECIES: hypothetical protein [unclassified Cupriavidus]|uniref:hypothetical protein n=1 Tax=unclassified Cupriavidus TaxID=2640874 RepID=UPI00088AA640|nr:hypothetical protein [Cupriavidus sp. YR651]SDD16706.1 hypothetical protein SAMN05216345_106283 [Cupriavidus sp. YR651]
MRFHPEIHVKDLAGRLHWPHRTHERTTVISRSHSASEDAEVAKATLYVSTVTLVVLLVVLAGISFGQEAMHWLGVQ